MRKLQLVMVSMVTYVLVTVVFSSSTYGQKIDRVEKLEGKSRKGKVERVVIHATGGPDCNPGRNFKSGTLNGIVRLFKENKNISIHYIVGRDGKRVQMVPEGQIAYHVKGKNSTSIGIELINNGDGKDPYPDEQIDSLTGLLTPILKRHSLGPADLVGHSELDNSELDCNGKKIKRKQDPGDNFPWDRVRAALKQNEPSEGR